MPDENKEQAELEKLLNEEPVDEGEGEEGGEKVPKIKPEGSEGEEEGEKGKEGEGEEEEEFKGKSREEVIKLLKEQRQKVVKLEDKEKGKGKGEGKDKKGEGEKEEEEPTVPTPEELQKMTPSDFAKWVLARIDEGVKKTIESQDKVKSAVKKEIADAKKEHNLGDPDFRRMVLAIIEAASAKGTVMPLKDACKQVDAFLGKHKDKGKLSDEEKSRLKKAKAQVESGAGAPTKPDSSDAETKRIQKALEGSGQKSPLGGLGV